MFEFDELEASLPPEVYVVHTAGTVEVNGIYQDTGLKICGAPIFRHITSTDQILAREQFRARHGWALGSSGLVQYGVRTDDVECPKTGWSACKGAEPTPTVEGFSCLADASHCMLRIWRKEAESLASQQKFKHAAEVYSWALSLPILSKTKRAEIHALRAQTFRQLAESKKRVPRTTKPSSNEIEEEDDDPLHGLAAEWAITEAEEALKHDDRCFLAAWEGAIAAKHIGWWKKGRVLAKQAMQSLPTDAAHSSKRETASTLFLLLAEEEQEEKTRKVRSIELSREVSTPGVNSQELQWATGVATQLRDALKLEDFKRPHHQLWKLVGPGMGKEESDKIFDEIRQLTWEKWNAIAWQYGYRTSGDAVARRMFCTRIVDVANATRDPTVKDLIKEIEDRICIEWHEIAEAVERIRHDETWAWTKHEDGSWGAWNGPTTL